MLSVAMGMGLSGIEGFPVQVEVNLSPGLTQFELVGLPDAAVKESRERVRTALRNSGFRFPDDRLTVNLAPADQRKEGPVFDLPIALGIISACGQLDREAFADTVLLGELALGGEIRPVRGALPLIISARERGLKRALLPEGNAREVRCVEGIQLYPVSTLREAYAFLSGREALEPMKTAPYAAALATRSPGADFAFVKGHEGAKRALEIAAAGGHNAIMIGPPGSGKTLLARCVPGILPDMSFEEALEATRIHSAAGAALDEGLLVERPFRAPHHTASSAALIGGGANALPGEISKAHNGVLFLDELPEYRRDVLEALRQPLEDGYVTVARASVQSTYPASFMLICSMNPCPCGNYGSRVKQCRCNSGEIRRYLNKISGPLLDRIDLHIEVESVPPERIASAPDGEPSSAVRERVESARARQKLRYAGEPFACNARLDARTLDRYCRLNDEARDMLSRAAEAMGLSSRAYTRVIKVARTIADMVQREDITASDVAEALQYRALDRKYWG